MAYAEPTRREAVEEIGKCYYSPVYFAHHYCHIYSKNKPAPGQVKAVGGRWIPFKLWPAQGPAMLSLRDHRQVIWLKARQLGMTWLALACALHALLYSPGSTVLLFSLRDLEAIELLKRLRGMYALLPEWMKVRGDSEGGKHEWPLSNGSRCLAFPTTAGDSYTANLVIVDEADLVPDLERLLSSAQPTIDGGGQILLLSRSNKKAPLSTFKTIYRSARDGTSPWHPVFLPWHARPDRDEQWYENERRNSLAQTGSVDSLWEQYPASDEQALAANTLDKRIPLGWLDAVTKTAVPLTLEGMKAVGAPGLPGLKVWKAPEAGRKYAIGADPAEGNPTSDDSALCVLDAKTGEQVAAAAGKWDPTVFAGYVDKVGTWYNSAAVMVERANHGHAVQLWLRDNSRLRRLRGHDKNDGWLSSTTGKVMLYDAVTDVIRKGGLLIRDAKTYHQLASIEGTTLRAPEGMHDDASDAVALAAVAMPQAGREVIRMESF